MLKKSILLASVCMSQFALASVDQFQDINKSYDLSCVVNNNGKVITSTLSLQVQDYEQTTYVVADTSLLGTNSGLDIELKDQKKLDYKSEDTFPNTYNYTETRFPTNEIVYKNTVKSGILGREKLQIGLNIKFTDKKLNKGTLVLSTYWPKQNNVTVCSVTER